jgi:hypothetical protein
MLSLKEQCYTNGQQNNRNIMSEYNANTQGNAGSQPLSRNFGRYHCRCGNNAMESYTTQNHQHHYENMKG